MEKINVQSEYSELILMMLHMHRHNLQFVHDLHVYLHLICLHQLMELNQFRYTTYNNNGSEKSDIFANSFLVFANA